MVNGFLIARPILHVIIFKEYFSMFVLHNPHILNTIIFRCTDPYQPGAPIYQLKDGGSCKNITKMYECVTYEWGETLNCRDKAQCLEMLVSSRIAVKY